MEDEPKLAQDTEHAQEYLDLGRERHLSRTNAEPPCRSKTVATHTSEACRYEHMLTFSHIHRGCGHHAPAKLRTIEMTPVSCMIVYFLNVPSFRLST